MIKLFDICNKHTPMSRSVIEIFKLETTTRETHRRKEFINFLIHTGLQDVDTLYAFKNHQNSMPHLFQRLNLGDSNFESANAF
ncbi:hypothetical protein BpHYR1_000036 [Brachionus plicatilis]|uniref:Uncharacterized protein n=1 Tax=Brachionus plicatilis TaxID=10195 RepID=A0A3M7QJQ7_BRAPC|nr:hypothetical protein BpHYR1_000036 [Brachionus plicatilis]